MTFLSRDAYLIRVPGPEARIPGRVAALIERHTTIDQLRIRARGSDPELTAALEALHTAALHWRTSATGYAQEPEPEVRRGLNYYSTGQAAERLQMTSRGIRLAITQGRLTATKVGNGYRIAATDLAHYTSTRAA